MRFSPIVRRQYLPVISAVFAVVAACPHAADAALPTNDPCAAYHQSWTNALPWSRVFNALDYGAKADGKTDNLAAFEKARNAAAAAGGGVVYIPPGVYFFSGDLVLQNGIILRGADPARVPSALDAAYDPPTHFEFPQYHFSAAGNGAPVSTAFKGIRTADGASDSNEGVVNIAINRAFIDLYDNDQKGTAFKAGMNRFVVGCTLRNAVVPQGYFGYAWNRPVPAPEQHPWQRYPDLFSFAIRVISRQNALVANNRLLPATDNFVENGYLIRDVNKQWVSVDNLLFDYDNRYGIIVNRPWSGINGTRGGFAATPETDPVLFGAGVLVANNYVRNTGRVALYVAGQGAVIRHNTALNQPDGPVGRYGIGGLEEARGSGTNENRGIDFCGYDVTVEANTYEAHQGKLLVNYPTLNDGEGILMQEWSGTAAIRERILHNRGNTYIGLYDEGLIDHCTIANNTVTDAGIMAFAQEHTQPSRVNDTIITGNHITGGSINVGGYSPGCRGIRISGNTAETPSIIGLRGKVHDAAHGGDTVVKDNHNFTVVNRD